MPSGRRYHYNRGSVDLALEHNRLARQAISAAAGQGPLFPMLAELPLQEAGAHLLAGDLQAAASALQRGTAPLSAPIVDEFRSPAAAAWVAFLQGDLVSAGAALDRVAGAAAEHHAVGARAGTDPRQPSRGGDPPGATRTPARRGPAGRSAGGGTDQRPPGPPGHGRHLDRPAGHRSRGPGRRAGVSGPGAPGPHRARRQGPGTVRARGVPHRTRPGARRSERADPAAAGQTPPQGCSRPGCTSCGGSGRRPSRSWTK